MKEELIFVVEDDKAFNKLITQFLNSKGYKNIKSFYSGEEAVKNLSLNPRIFIQDYDMGVMSGLDVLKAAKKHDETIEFIFLSGQESIEIAVEILKHGAFDYIIKDASAQSNLNNRLGKLLTIKKLTKDKALSRIAILIISLTLCISWVVVVILYYFVFRG